MRRLAAWARSDGGGVLLGIASLAPFFAFAADPTRPPDGGFTAASAAPRASLAASAASSPAVPPPPVLQSLRLQNDGTASALVNGQLLRVGDTWSGRSVTAIDRDGITLRGGGAPLRLSWSPGVTKSAAGTTPPAGESRAHRSAQLAPELPAHQPPATAAGSESR